MSDEPCSHYRLAHNAFHPHRRQCQGACLQAFFFSDSRAKGGRRADGDREQIIIVDGDDVPDVSRRFKKPEAMTASSSEASESRRHRLALILPKKRQRVESDCSTASADEQRKSNFVYGECVFSNSLFLSGGNLHRIDGKRCAEPA